MPYQMPPPIFKLTRKHLIILQYWYSNVRNKMRLEIETYYFPYIYIMTRLEG